jgi:hypothetical protein
LATRAISANSQADFHQHVSATLLAAAQEWFRLPCPFCECPANGEQTPKIAGWFQKVAKPAITSIAFSNLPLAADSLIDSH